MARAQNCCTLLVYATIRQSSRAFASAPVRQTWARSCCETAPVCPGWNGVWIPLLLLLDGSPPPRTDTSR